ncbi:MAG: sulfur carrier protein ThiS [Candidatus Omnitrophica bacterium]|nr:sulfur carrier protein ThiS [Candidatus Omnitrophota bacterium]
MELIVNGERKMVPEGITAVKLLEHLKVQPEQVVVEVNLEIVKRAQLAGTMLKDGDQVEIVRLVGGGS